MNRLKLLCVDDDSAIQQLYRSIFASYGYDVAVAADARQALDLLRSAGDSFHAVLSDYEMPEMNGAQLAAIVKRSWPELPFIMISGSPRDKDELPDCVDAMIEKGCPVKELVARLESVLLPRASRSVVIPNYTWLGSALAGVASAAFLLLRLLK